MADSTYYLLYKSSGHNIVNTISVENINEAREQMEGFVIVSDERAVTLTLNQEIAQNWERNCYHCKKHKEE
ncbi:hypothetical protein A2130_01695 [Candidatus Woesebacteria bacterium GWC2_33_12]|uniref:Uncharacterized protein n=1 Tax=Candidatus Woesebacteria bacterium GW2011_GWB1_33_22 TaxID=1618566 RepID=A0A0G0CNE7_9BACT|nr:MAG: hypothetical protein UR29_C0007G0057 [Candidatus Woesebacteria bacterium GW2011_GWC2_33_12]KKP42193.1 MAG: hypothetical protein UR33_C0005G0057 [Candidatus Woesebacteria bacterium GW2011_GWA2_33_20]KKP44927.1 MAG: hypothetical protein UR35_C0005G0057 [Candidatus Woesebacteria bacterium GW2011_GWB1_33_22]KKP46741.1 MAG: hypothetical protein UR37_C0005G0057 [Microgenomates group bacterium GW2011_GWC1_33_28]KKP50641.1 MAG: hypothetical protein UR41_C0005G0057 [Candidatus Woesebacteria bact